MPTNLEDIGFESINEVTRAKMFLDYIEKNGIRKPTYQGNYFLFNPNDNIELWYYLSNDRNNFFITPYYAGKTRTEIKVINAIDREFDGPKLYSWINPRADDGDAQVVFEVPDFWIMDFDRLRGMSQNIVQLTAFARDVRLYENEKDFQDSKGEIGKTLDGKTMQYASNYFIPTGAFSEPKDAFARFAGEIKETKEVQNNYSLGKFYLMIVNTFFGDLDVVCAKKAFEKNPDVGDLIDGHFYLSGKLVFD